MPGSHQGVLVIVLVDKHAPDLFAWCPTLRAHLGHAKLLAAVPRANQAAFLQRLPLGLDDFLFLPLPPDQIVARLQLAEQALRYGPTSRSSLGAAVRSIAHDVNNQLMGVLGNAELLVESVEHSGPLRLHAERILVAARGLAQLANDLLSVCRDRSMEGAQVNVPVSVPAPDEVTSSCKSERPSVLVVDDEDVTRQVVATMVRRAGYNVLMAASGQEALTVFAQHSQQIHCVLLDYTLPGMDGPQIWSKLREINAEVKVLLMSGYKQEASAASVQMSGFLRKPFSLRDLVLALEQLQDGVSP